MKPNFIVIGAMKCATTSFCADLATHPEIFVSDPREPGFFGIPNVWDKGWQWYESLFDGANGAKAVGEGSTSYTKNHLFPDAPARIAKHLPEAKLIYMVRNPFKRIESHWRHRVIHHGDPLDFNEGLKYRFDRYIDFSLYWRQINLYRNFFSDDAILILFTEDYRSSRWDVLKRTFEFLEVDPDYMPTPQEDKNVSVGRSVDGSLVHRLRTFSVTQYIPNVIKKRIKKSLSRKLPATLQWEPDLRRQAENMIWPDTVQFLRHYGKPLDFWGAAPERWVDWINTESRHITEVG